MRVAHYCNVFSKLSETFIYDVITELELQRVDNIVFANRIENELDRPFGKVVPVKEVREPFWERQVTKLLVKLNMRSRSKIKRKLRRRALHGLFKKYHPDVVHCHFGPQGCMALPPALALNIPLVVSFHGFDAFKLPNEPVWKNRYQLLFEKAAAVTVVSHLMQEHLATLGCPAEKIHVIHVGKRIPEYAFKTLADRPVKTFVSIGRMEEKKGHLDAIKLFSELATRHPEVRLQIIGGGSMMPQARDLVSQLQAEDVIDLKGEVSHSSVKDALDKADAFILCSKTAADGDKEGIPTVLMEAQLIGLPCVSTQHSGIPEVIPQENQWLLAPESDVDSLSAVVERLMNTPMTELETVRQRARSKVEAEFDLSVETAKLRQLYQTLIPKK